MEAAERQQLMDELRAGKFVLTREEIIAVLNKALGTPGGASLSMVVLYFADALKEDCEEFAREVRWHGSHCDGRG